MARRAHKRLHGLLGFLAAMGLVVSGCGDDEPAVEPATDTSSAVAVRSSDGAAWSSWTVQSEKEVTAAELGPLCLTFTGDVAGTYAEHVSPDERSSVGVFELSGDDDGLDELEALYRRLDECVDDGLRIEQLAASDTTVSWQVQVVVDGESAGSEFLGFSRRGANARVVFGSGPDAPGSEDEASWSL